MTPVILGRDPRVYGGTYVPLDYAFQPRADAVEVYTHPLYEMALDAEQARARGDRDLARALASCAYERGAGQAWYRMLATVRQARGQA